MAGLTLTRQVYSLAEARDVLGWSDRTMRERIKAGDIEARKDGREWRVSAAAIREYWDRLPSNRPAA